MANKITFNEDVNAVLKNIGSNEEKQKTISLLEWFNEEIEEVETLEISEWHDSEFIINNHVYRVFNEEEKDDALKECIENSLWTFSSSFLAEQTDWDLLPVFESFVKNDLCESANDAILAIVEKFSDLDTFVEETVNADGAGVFLASYDHEEIELDNNLYAYRN